MIQRVNSRQNLRQAARSFGKQDPERAPSAFLPFLMMLILFAVMVIPEGLDYLGANGIPTEGDPVSRTTWMVLLTFSTILVFRNRVQVRELIAASNRPFLAFIVLATLSLVWSIEPGFTFKRIFRLYLIVLVCLSFCIVGWKPGQFQRYLRFLFFLILASSLIFGYVNPDLAIHQVGDLAGSWRGITTGKNVLGSLAGCGFILWLHAYLAREGNRFVALGNIVIAGWCLFLSQSSTSLMATLFGLLLALLLMRSPGSMRRYLPYMVGTFAVAVLLYALAVLQIIPGMDIILQPISMITGKDQTFTGRTNIWYVLKLHIQQNPLLGTGLGAYWIGRDPASPSFEMIRLLHFYPTEGHNGYLDVINDLGYVGECCLLAYFVSYLRQAVSLMRLDRSAGALYLTIIFRAFLADMSETHWFSVLSIDFVIFTLATFSLSRELMHARASGLETELPRTPRRFDRQLPSPSKPLAGGRSRS